LKTAGVDLRIVSDANTFFIEQILLAKGLEGVFSEIVTNPGLIEDGLFFPPCAIGIATVAVYEEARARARCKCALEPTGTVRLNYLSIDSLTLNCGAPLQFSPLSPALQLAAALSRCIFAHCVKENISLRPFSDANVAQEYSELLHSCRSRTAARYVPPPTCAKVTSCGE